MTTREYRHVIIDDNTVVEMEVGKLPYVLDEKRAKQMLRALGLTKEPVTVPNRSFELATTEQTSGNKLIIRGKRLQVLSTLAEYNEPLTGSAIRQLLAERINPQTVSSILSALKKIGFVSAHGVPSQYMVTGTGHAALITAVETKANYDAALGRLYDPAAANA